MIGGRLDLDKDAQATDALAKADLRQAYERGRRDERAARKRHPFLMTITVVMALVGAVVLAMAAANGSFTDAGRVVDRQLNLAASQAAPAVNQAASAAGENLREAGQSARARVDRAG